jgi:hypothetical protein
MRGSDRESESIAYTVGRPESMLYEDERVS